MRTYAGLVITSAPATQPVTVAEAKAHVRQDADADDTLIGSLIEAATKYVESQSERALVTRTYRLSIQSAPKSGTLELPMPNLQEVTDIKYTDTDGVEQTWSSGDYQVDTASEPGRVLPMPGESWPTVKAGIVNPYRITYTAGYGNAAAVDPRAKQAILLIVGHWYQNREMVLTGTISKEVEGAVANLCAQIWPGTVRLGEDDDA